MKICPNLNDPQVKEEFETLKRLFGEDSAYYLWNKNKGNFLDRTADGDINTTYISNFEKYNDKEYALKTAALELLNSESYNNTDIPKAEPIKNTTTLELGKEALMDIVEGYHMNNKGQFKLEADQAIDLNNTIKAAGLKDVDVVSIGTKYQLYDRSLNKYITAKEIKNNPKYSLSASDIQNSIKNRILDELKKLGVEVQTVDSLKSQYGLDYLAVADITNKAIKFAKNEISLEALGEEGAHFFVEAMNDSPFVNRLMNLVKQNEAYKNILGDEFSEYNLAYKGDEDLLAKEAIGKLLGQYLIDVNTLSYKPAKNLLERLWNALKSIFSSKDNTSLEKLLNNELKEFAHDILTNKAKGLNKTSLLKSSIDKLYSIGNRAKSLEDVMNKVIETEALRLKIYENQLSSISTKEAQRKLVVELNSALEKGTIKERIASYISGASKVMQQLTEQLNKENELLSNNSISKSAHIARRMKSFLVSVQPIVTDMQRYLREDKSDPEFNSKMHSLISEFLVESNAINDELQLKMFNIFAKWIGTQFDKFAEVENPFGEKLTRQQVIDSLTKANKDNNWFNRWISSASDNPDIVINLVATAFKNTEGEKRMKVKDVHYQLINAVKELNDAGIKDFDWIFEKINGEYSQNFNSEWDYSSYEVAKSKLWETLRKKFPENPIEREKAFIANPELQKEWAKIWSEFNRKYVEKVEGWENIIYNKEKTLPRGEFLKWKSKNVNEYIDSKGNTIYTPNVYGELAHPKQKNKAFEEIKNNPAKLKFYNTINKIMKESLNLLPADIKGVTPNMAPRIRADFRERVVQEGFIKAFKTKDALSAIQIRADEDEFGYRYEERLQDFEGNTVQFLPIYYTSKIKDATFSTDLIGNVLRFYDMSINYNLKSKMIDILEVGKNILSERLVKIGSNGLESKVTIPVLTRLIQRESKVKAENLYKGYKDLIDKGLYGEYQKNEGSFKIPFIKGEFDIAKSMNAVRDAVQYIMLGGSPFVGFANQVTGELSILNEAASKRFFDYKDRAFAAKEVMKLMPEYLAEVGSVTPDSKLFYLTSFFDMLGDYDQELKDLNSNVKNKLLRGLSFNSLMLPIQLGDFSNKMSVGIAMLHNTKVLNSEGKQVSLYDQFEVKNGIPGIKEGTKNLDGSDFTKSDLVAFMNRLGKLNTQLFGMTDKIDRAPLQSRSIGRAFSIFRSFLGPNLNRRYSINKLDTSLGIYTEGYYNTLLKFVLYDLKDAHFNILTAWDKLTDGQKQNMHIAITELATLGIMTILIMTIGALAGKADEDNEKRLQALRLMLARTRTELAALSPLGIFSETTRMFQSPTAILGLVDSLSDVFSGAWFETYEKGDYKGWNKGFIKTLRLVPGSRLIFDFMTIDEKLKWYGLD